MKEVWRGEERKGEEGAVAGCSVRRANKPVHSVPGAGGDQRGVPPVACSADPPRHGLHNAIQFRGEGTERRGEEI